MGRPELGRQYKCDDAKAVVRDLMQPPATDCCHAGVAERVLCLTAVAIERIHAQISPLWTRTTQADPKVRLYPNSRSDQKLRSNGNIGSVDYASLCFLEHRIDSF
jgi:hypothetical protein